MSRKYLILVLLLLSARLSAQVPYYGYCPEKGLVTGYTSLSYYTADTTFETYTFLQYAITDYLAAGIHLGTYGSEVTWGPELRGGYNVCEYFNFSLHAMPNFDLTDNFRFSYASIGLYMDGAILKDRKLFWLTNTYSNIFRDGSATWWQYWYLGSDIRINQDHCLTPVVGFDHSWRFDQKPDLDVGIIYAYKNWSFMLWCSEIISCRPFLSLAIEFDIPTK